MIKNVGYIALCNFISQFCEQSILQQGSIYITSSVCLMCICAILPRSATFLKSCLGKITHTQNNVINYVLHQNSVYVAVYNKPNLVLGRKGAGMIYLVYKCFDVPEEQFIFISILSMA